MINGLNKKIFFIGEIHEFQYQTSNNNQYKLVIKPNNIGFFTIVLNPISNTLNWVQRKKYTVTKESNIETQEVIVLPNKQLAKWAEFLSEKIIFTLKKTTEINISNLNSLQEVKDKISNKLISYDSFFSILQKCWQKFKVTNKKQLFLDITAFRFEKSWTGIQRVTRSYLFNLLKIETIDFEIIPVYGDETWGFFRADNWIHNFLYGKDRNEPEDPIVAKTGDIFFGLNLELHSIPVLESFLLEMSKNGVIIKFLIHDILPITNPDWFEYKNTIWFKKWIDVVCKFNGVICVSKHTATKLKNWMVSNNIWKDNFSINWNHLGSDINANLSSKGIPLNNILEELNNSINFLMLGTIEPRKAHLDALKKFELIAQSNKNIKLIIVGRWGWKNEIIKKKLFESPLYLNQIFIINDASDEYLDEIFKKTDCLIGNSYDEGFGLPLVEAGIRNVPIICRDIEPFREIIKGVKFYKDLEYGLRDWLLDLNNDEIIYPQYKIITWEESTKKLYNLIVYEKSSY